MTSVNFSAYDRVEDLSQYRDDAALGAYRAERLAKYSPEVEFLSLLGTPCGGFRIADIGSGSSAFLYAVEAAGMLADGLAVELSKSRHAFAERWRLDAGFSRVRNVQGNFTLVDLAPDHFDLFTILDDTFLLLRPEDPSYPEKLLRRAYEGLVRRGRFVAAFRNDALNVKRMSSGDHLFWQELPESNAFRFALYRQRYSAETRAITKDSIYIARDGRDTRKTEVTDVCDVDALVELARIAGFGEIALFDNYAMAPFEPHRSARVLMVATK